MIIEDIENKIENNEAINHTYNYAIQKFTEENNRKPNKKETKRIIQDTYPETDWTGETITDDLQNKPTEKNIKELYENNKGICIIEYDNQFSIAATFTNEQIKKRKEQTAQSDTTEKVIYAYYIIDKNIPMRLIKHMEKTYSTNIPKNIYTQIRNHIIQNLKETLRKFEEK